jgi:LPXTG-motif cell wall-anchored protein
VADVEVLAAVTTSEDRTSPWVPLGLSLLALAGLLIGRKKVASQD